VTAISTVWTLLGRWCPDRAVDTNQGIATPELADEWFKETDPQGVVFSYEVIEE